MCQLWCRWWGDGAYRNDVSLLEFSGTPGPQINRPATHFVTGMIHPCHFMHDTIHILYVVKMTGMYQSRDIVSQGTINLGTRGPRTFVRGHNVSGRPVTPIAWVIVNIGCSLAGNLCTDS